VPWQSMFVIQSVLGLRIFSPTNALVTLSWCFLHLWPVDVKLCCHDLPWFWRWWRYHWCLFSPTWFITLEGIPKMQLMHLQLDATNCHLQLVLIRFSTMPKLHLWLIIFSSYTLKLFSSMIYPYVPLVTNETKLICTTKVSTPNGKKLLKIMCTFAKFY